MSVRTPVFPAHVWPHRPHPPPFLDVSGFLFFDSPTSFSDSPGTRTPRGHAAQARPRATSALFWARGGGGMITRGRPSTLPPPLPPPLPINGCSSTAAHQWLLITGCSSMAAHRSTASHQRPCSSTPCSSTPCSSAPCSSTPCSSTAPTYSTILSSSVKVFLVPS